MSDSEEFQFSDEEDSDDEDLEIEDEEDEEEQDEEQSEDEESLRNDLAQTTFEDLLAMRDKLGTKVYRDSVLKQLSASTAAADQTTPGNKDRQTGRQASKQFKETKPKSQPIVANSKRLETKHNFAILPVPSLATKAKAFRDPRFESTSGTFQADKFEDNYRFLNSMKKRELEVLQKRLKRTKSPEEKDKLTRSMNILRAQLRAETQKDKAKEVEKNVKTVIAKDFAPQNRAPPPPPPPSTEVTSFSQKAPQKPKVFVNKGVVKRAQLVAKFKELKKRGKLDKYIERKRKKNAGKERKYLDQRI